MKFVFTLLGVLISHYSMADNQCRTPALNILLTNDDGVMTVGIQEMHRALAEAGHSVKRIAPDRNYSGSGASLTRPGVVVEDLSSDEFSNVYAVSGSPATSVLLGATAIFQPDEQLDLIVSGINDGPNIGPAPTVSGTVGAVLTGLNLLHPAVPGIAISTRPVTYDEKSQEYRDHFLNVANFVSRIVGIIGCDEPSLLDTNQALHINYPPLAPGAIKGVRRADQGRGWRIEYVKNDDDEYEMRFARVPLAANKIGDTTLFNDGYITIVPIDGEYTTTPEFEIDQVLSVDP